jgi:hypothetical protein
MNTTHQTEAQTSQTTEPKGLGDLSFTDYQEARRTGKMPEVKPSAPASQKGVEQKKSGAPEALETDALEDNEIKDESDELDGDEPEGKEDESEKDEKPAQKKKGGFQRRIDKLNAKIAERERELEYFRKLALKDAEPTEKSKVESQKSAEATDGEPDPGTFETHAEYVKALTKWEIKQEKKAQAEEENRSKLVSDQEKTVKAHQERVKAYSEKNDDFWELIESVDDVVVSPAIGQLIMQSENGPELMLALAKDRKEYERINKLSPLDAARALGRIEAKLQASEEETKKPTETKITKAPKPIDPVGASKSSVNKSPEEMTFTEYEARRREEMKRKRA